MDPLIAIPVLTLCGLLAAPFFIPKRESIGRRRLPVLLTLLIPPTSSWAWGYAFGISPGCADRPWWVTGALVGFVIASIILPLALLPIMSGGRRFTIAIGLFALGLTLGVSFLADMQVTGCWI